MKNIRKLFSFQQNRKMLLLAVHRENKPKGVRGCLRCGMKVDGKLTCT